MATKEQREVEDRRVEKKMSLDLSFCFLSFFPPPKTMLSVLESLFLFSLAREVFLFFWGGGYL